MDFRRSRNRITLGLVLAALNRRLSFIDAGGDFISYLLGIRGFAILFFSWPWAELVSSLLSHSDALIAL